MQEYPSSEQATDRGADQKTDQIPVRFGEQLTRDRRGLWTDLIGLPGHYGRARFFSFKKTKKEQTIFSIDRQDNRRRRYLWVSSLCRFFVSTMSNSLKSRPIRKPISDVDLLRFVDAVIFGEKAGSLTELEIKTARETQPYKMLQRIGATMYRAGEQGLRPRPSLQVVQKAEPKTE